MKVYCENRYESFKDLMKTTYDNVFSDEKSGFTAADAITLLLFSTTLDSLCGQFNEEINNEREEE